MRVPNHIAIILDGNGRWQKKEACREASAMSKDVKIWKISVKWQKNWE